MLPAHLDQLQGEAVDADSKDNNGHLQRAYTVRLSTMHFNLEKEQAIGTMSQVKRWVPARLPWVTAKPLNKLLFLHYAFLEIYLLN